MTPIAGIDIGGTKVRWILMDKDRVVAAHETRTPKDKAEFQRAIRDLLVRLRARGVRNAGIGVAGVVSGTVLMKSPNLPALRDVNFAALAPAGMHVRVDNDARCFARAEVAFGRGRQEPSVLTIILGTGVGRALVRKGKVQMHKEFEYPEGWEREYRRRRTEDPSRLAKFLAPKIAELARKGGASLIILAGGGLRPRGMFQALRRELAKQGDHKISRSHFRQNAAVIGAALLARSK